MTKSLNRQIYKNKVRESAKIADLRTFVFVRGNILVMFMRVNLNFYIFSTVTGK